MLTLSLTTIYLETAANVWGVKTEQLCLIYKCNKYPKRFSVCLTSSYQEGKQMSQSGYSVHTLRGVSVQTLLY